MKLKILVIAVLAFCGAAANATEVTGKINFYDCSQVIAKPANPKFANGCVVAFTGQSTGVSFDGTHWINDSTQIAVSSQRLAPKMEAALKSGTTLVMDIDLNNAILIDFKSSK